MINRTRRDIHPICDAVAGLARALRNAGGLWRTATLPIVLFAVAATLVDQIKFTYFLPAHFEWWVTNVLWSPFEGVLMTGAYRLLIFGEAAQALPRRPLVKSYLALTAISLLWAIANVAIESGYFDAATAYYSMVVPDMRGMEHAAWHVAHVPHLLKTLLHVAVIAVAGYAMARVVVNAAAPTALASTMPSWRWPALIALAAVLTHSANDVLALTVYAAGLEDIRSSDLYERQSFVLRGLLHYGLFGIVTSLQMFVLTAVIAQGLRRLLRDARAMPRLRPDA